MSEPNTTEVQRWQFSACLTVLCTVFVLIFLVAIMLQVGELMRETQETNQRISNLEMIFAAPEPTPKPER